MPALTVVVEQLLAPVPGGTGRYAAQIGTALARTAPDGWSVRSVTAWHRDVTAAELPGVDGPHRLPMGNRALSQAWMYGLPPWPSGDSVQATTPLAPIRRSLSRPLGRPVVVTVHDTVPWTHPETLTPRGVAWHRRMVERAVRGADALVTPSTAVAESLTSLIPAAAGRIEVIGHGVTRVDPPADAADRARRLGLPPRYVLSVATVEPRKGLDVLVRALGEVPDARLVLVGQPGWGGVDVARWAADAGVADRVLSLGRLDDADLAVAMGRAAVLAVPSRAEGFGLPVLEGMAAGVPVVTSDAAALVEVGGGATVVVPVDDPKALAAALRRVLDRPDEARDLAQRGRRRAAAFDWDDAARALWRLHLRLRAETR